MRSKFPSTFSIDAFLENLINEAFQEYYNTHPQIPHRQFHSPMPQIPKITDASTRSKPQSSESFVGSVNLLSRPTTQRPIQSDFSFQADFVHTILEGALEEYYQSHPLERPRLNSFSVRPPFSDHVNHNLPPMPSQASYNHTQTFQNLGFTKPSPFPETISAFPGLSVNEKENFCTFQPTPNQESVPLSPNLPPSATSLVVEGKPIEEEIVDEAIKNGLNQYYSTNMVRDSKPLEINISKDIITPSEKVISQTRNEIRKPPTKEYYSTNLVRDSTLYGDSPEPFPKNPSNEIKYTIKSNDLPFPTETTDAFPTTTPFLREHKTIDEKIAEEAIQNGLNEYYSINTFHTITTQPSEKAVPKNSNNDNLTTHQNKEAFPSSQNKEAFPSSQNKEAFPTTQNKEAFPSSQRPAPFPPIQNKEAFPTTHKKEAFPSSQNRIPFPSAQNTVPFPSTSPNKEAFPSQQQNKLPFPSTPTKEEIPSSPGVPPSPEKSTDSKSFVHSVFEDVLDQYYQKHPDLSPVASQDQVIKQRSMSLAKIPKPPMHSHKPPIPTKPRKPKTNEEITQQLVDTCCSETIEEFYKKFPERRHIEHAGGSQSSVLVPENLNDQLHPFPSQNKAPWPLKQNSEPFPSPNKAPFPPVQNKAPFPPVQNKEAFPSNKSPSPLKQNSEAFPSRNKAPFPPAQNKIPFPSPQNKAPFPSKPNSEAFPSIQNKEAFPTSQNKEAFPTTQNKEAFPTSQNKEAFPSSQPAPFPSIHNKEKFPSQQNKEPFPSTQKTEAFSSTETKEPQSLSKNIGHDPFPQTGSILMLIADSFVDESIKGALMEYYCCSPEQKPRGFGQSDFVLDASIPNKTTPSSISLPEALVNKSLRQDRRLPDRSEHEVVYDFITTIITDSLYEYRLSHPLYK